MSKTDEDSVRHSPEPWNLYGPFDDGYVGVTSGEEQPGKRRIIARTDSPSVSLPQAERDANARRICAAVNACKGIETETLEKLLTEGVEVGNIMEMAVSEKLRAGQANARADAAEVRLSRIAGIVEVVVQPRVVAAGIVEAGPATISMADLSKIYEAATLDRPVVAPLLEEARNVVRAILDANGALAEQCDFETRPFADEADTLPAIKRMGDAVIDARALLTKLPDDKP